MRKIIKKIKMKKENIMVVLSGAVFMTVMDVSNVLAAGDASSVTKPLDNLKTLVFAIIGAIGVIILATGKVDIGNNTDSNGFNFTNTYVQEADTGAPDPTRPDPVNPGTGPDDDYTKYGSLK